jgi:steroid 5-alpha reductase family enzyme
LKTIINILIATAVGLGTAWAGGRNGSAYGPISVLLLCAILAFAVNWLVYIPAAAAQTEKYYDLTGSLTYLTVIAVACYLSAPLDLRAGMVAVMVAVWAMRLGSFLFRRIHADGKDVRFDQIKTKPLKFLQAWTLQGTWVVLTAASALVIITSDTRLPADGFLIVGFAMWAAGFAIEVVADQQKSHFRAKAENKGHFINVGLWRWSRHPNYFGEILLWTGITVISLPLLSGWQWVTLISPLFVTFLLTKVSGIPMLDYNAKKRWGNDKDYQEYRARTPMLIPRPPKD